MSADPTTAEGRTRIRAKAGLGFGAPADVTLALLAALDEAECEVERLRGDLVIERRQSTADLRRAEKAESALDQAEKNNSELFDASLRYKYRANDFRTEARFQQARAEKAESALDRVRALCQSADGDWLESDFDGNTVGDIRRALDGGQ